MKVRFLLPLLAVFAGLLSGLACHGQARLSEVITIAQRCGALATTAKGAMTALPYHHELYRDGTYRGFRPRQQADPFTA